jgi:hypothetical protein
MTTDRQDRSLEHDSAKHIADRAPRRRVRSGSSKWGLIGLPRTARQAKIHRLIPEKIIDSDRAI